MSEPRLTPAAFAVVGIGSALGAGLREALSLAVPTYAHVAWVIVAINVIGCFALALLPGLRPVASRPLAMVFCGPGVLGGFTTLSAYAEQTRALAAAGRLGLAGGYALGTTLLCVGAAFLARRLIAVEQTTVGTGEGGEA